MAVIVRLLRSSPISNKQGLQGTVFRHELVSRSCTLCVFSFRDERFKILATFQHCTTHSSQRNKIHLARGRTLHGATIVEVARANSHQKRLGLPKLPPTTRRTAVDEKRHTGTGSRLVRSCMQEYARGPRNAPRS